MAPSAPRDYPAGAYYLTLAAGVIIAFAGAVIFLFAGVVIDLLVPGSAGRVILLLSGLGVLVGLLLIGFAWLLKHTPGSSPLWGALILILAAASLPFTLGGFGIGFLLALFGGILALRWKPSSQGPLFVYATAAGASPNSPSLQRVCPECGALSAPASTFCLKCGKPFPPS